MEQLLSLAGITCPKMARTGPGGPTESEPYSEEALQYTKELILQREVNLLDFDCSSKTKASPVCQNLPRFAFFAPFFAMLFAC